MDKRRVIDQILSHLREEQRRCADAARVAHAEATDEQSKAENKYDTRGLEASYLAHGQSLQAADIEEALRLYASFDSPALGSGDAIVPGALLELEQEGFRDLYLLGPAAGGAEIDLDGRELIVITVRSPLGKSLLGRHVGDALPGGAKIVSVA